MLKPLEVTDFKAIGLPIGSIKLIIDQVHKWNATVTTIDSAPDNDVILDAAGKAAVKQARGTIAQHTGYIHWP